MLGLVATGLDEIRHQDRDQVFIDGTPTGFSGSPLGGVVFDQQVNRPVSLGVKDH